MASPKNINKSKKTGTLGAIDNYKDQFVSINLKKTTYFGLGNDEGEMKLWLSPENWFDKMPENLTNKEADQIAQGIADGRIVLGQVWMPPVDKKKEVLDKYVKLLSEYPGLTPEFKEIIISLFRYKEEGNYTALEIFKAMLDKEKNTRNRPPFIAYLNDAIEAYVGPVQLVQDYPDDPENYKVTIDAGVVIASDREEKPEPNEFDFKGFDDPDHRSKVITEALG